ncbi:ZmpA/ZmpB/ZmpC family metallo-endopeptidase, partial [Streptococcus cuniculipharyngis]
TDRDKTVSGGLVKVYNGDQLVKEVSVTDFSEPVDLSDLSYGVPYTFESELVYNLRDGQQSKTVSHDQTVELSLKAEPSLALVEVVKNDDTRSARLTFELTDRDKTVSGGLVKVYNGDQLVKEVSVTDFSEPVDLSDLSYGVPYRFKTDLTYDLRDGQQSKTVSHDQTVELSLKAEPSLALVDVVKNDDTRSARLTFELTDRDKTVSGGLVKVYEGDQLVKAVSITDFSEPVDLSDLSYGVPYRFKTDLTYDLRDGQQSKTVSHDQTVELSLKAEPSLALVEVVKNDDTRSARLTFELTDRDKTVSGGLVKVYNGDQLVKEVSITDFSEPVDLSDLSYGVPYRFKTDLTYDLRDGQQSKTISHDQTVELSLKTKPVLELKTVETDDEAKQVRLTYQLTDSEQAYQAAVVKFYDGEKLIKEVPVTDLSQPVLVEGLAYNLPYTIKTEMTYDLRRGPEQETQTYPDPVELNLKKVVFKDVYQTTLYKYDNGQLVKQTDLTGIPEDLSTYFVKLESDKIKDVLLPVDQIVADGDSYKVKLAWPEMVETVDGQTSYRDGFEFTLGETQERRVDYSQLPGYHSANQMAYNNIEKLLPLYNAETIIKYGNQVDKSSKLYTTELVSLVPMVDNQFVTDYYSQHGQINRLMLHYLDGTVDYVDLTNGQFFKNSQVKEYSLAGTALIYTPDQFIQDQEALLDELTESLQAVDYFNGLTKLYPNLNYDNSLLIAERERIKASNNEQAKQSLMARQIDPLYLQPTYDKVKENIRTYLKSLLSQEAIYATKADGRANLDYLRDKFLKNKEKLLLGLAYVDRLYNVNYGDKNIKDLSLFRQDFFGQTVNPTDLIINLGASGVNNLMFSKSSETYQTYLGSKNGKTTIMDYLSAYNKLLTSQSDNDWFKSSSKAYIVETPSQEVPSANTEVYQSLSSRPNLQSYLLPLLTLSDEGIFIINNMTTINFGMYDRGIDMSLKEKDPAAYQKQVEDYQAKVRKAAEKQRDYYDLWYRIAKPEVKDRLHTNRGMPIPNWDGYLYNNRKTWMQPYGETASNRMLDFFGPIGKWYAPNGTGAYATGSLTHFVVDTMISDYGQALTTHEMTHNLDGRVYLGGYGRRPGLGADSFTTGFFESVNGAQNKRIGLNLHADYLNDNDGKFATQRNYNANVDRFQNMADVDEYVRGMFDVIYTLDAIEGEVYLASPLQKQKQLFRRMDAVNEGKVLARNRAITAEEWASLSFNSLADLVNNQVVIATNDEYAKDRAYENTGYNVSLMFVPMYGALTYDKSPDNLTFKRLSYELWAELGYEGMLNYASDKLRRKAINDRQDYNDRYILKETFGDKYQDFAAFKLDMLEGRLAKAKAGNLKPVSFTYKGKTYQATYEQIKTLMTQTVANNPKETAVLKEAIYRAYLLDTDDFRQSIYQ